MGKKIKVAQKLSEYQLQIIEDTDFSLGKNKKLVLNLSNKKIQISLSKLKTSLKFRVTTRKNIRLLDFKQEPFSKHVERNTDL